MFIDALLVDWMVRQSRMMTPQKTLLQSTPLGTSWMAPTSRLLMFQSRILRREWAHVRERTKMSPTNQKTVLPRWTIKGVWVYPCTLSLIHIMFSCPFFSLALQVFSVPLFVFCCWYSPFISFFSLFRFFNKIHCHSLLFCVVNSLFLY